MLEKIEQDHLLSSLKFLINNSKNQLAVTVNQEMTLLYWRIGKTIQTEILRLERQEYGEQIIDKLGASLQFDYGSGFGSRVLRRTIQFFNCFPDYEIVSTLSTKLTWSHFVELFPIQDNQVAQYLTVLPPKEVFEKKVQDIIRKTKEMFPLISKSEEDD